MTKSYLYLLSFVEAAMAQLVPCVGEDLVFDS